MKIVLLIACNDIGGAEFVSLQHVKMLKDANANFIVLSAEQGNFFNKMKEYGANVVYIPQLNYPTAQSFLEPYLKDCDIVFNCNFFAITKYVADLKQKYYFRYLTILHSNIDWVFDQIMPFDAITDGYYSIHDKIKDCLITRGINENKITVIPNTVETKMIPLKSPKQNKVIRKTLGISETELVLGMTTRIAADKNIKDAFKVLELVNMKTSCSLVIIGEAPDNANCKKYKNELLSMISASPFKHKVFILGKKTSEEVYQYQQCFDIAINTSPNEGLPISMLEQMAAGIYCVYPGVGDIPEVLAGKGSVISVKQRLSQDVLYKGYTSEEILAFVNDIVRLSKKDLAKLGKKSREFILQNRSNEAVKNDFIRFINPINKIEGKCIVSVLMPVYNTNIEHLKKAVVSVLEQSFKNFEFIIVDDGSTDPEVKCFLKYLMSTCNVIRLEHNMGLAAALNVGIESAGTNLIARMDSDDIAHSDWLCKMVNFMYSTPEAVICGCQLKSFGNSNHVTRHPAVINKTYALQPGLTWLVNHPGIIYRKDTIQALGSYGNIPQSLAIEDWYLWCKILEAGHVIYNIPDILINYRVENGRIDTPKRKAFREKCRDTLKVNYQDKVTYHMATMPDRIDALKESINSILPQCDELHIYLNNFKVIPEFLKHSKIKLYLSADHYDDITDVGKFFNCDSWSGYNFTVDDKIIYPPDYTERTIAKIEQYNRKSIVSYHGRIMHTDRPSNSYYKDFKYVADYLSNVPKDIKIHIPGTGVMAFHSEFIKFDLGIFTQTNMSDILMGNFAQTENIDVVALQHASGWLKVSRHYDKSRSICNTFANNDHVQTSLVNSIKYKKL